MKGRQRKMQTLDGLRLLRARQIEVKNNHYQVRIVYPNSVGVTAPPIIILECDYCEAIEALEDATDESDDCIISLISPDGRIWNEIEIFEAIDEVKWERRREEMGGCYCNAINNPPCSACCP